MVGIPLGDVDIDLPVFDEPCVVFLSEPFIAFNLLNYINLALRTNEVDAHILWRARDIQRGLITSIVSDG